MNQRLMKASCEMRETMDDTPSVVEAAHAIQPCYLRTAAEFLEAHAALHTNES